MLVQLTGSWWPHFQSLFGINYKLTWRDYLSPITLYVVFPTHRSDRTRINQLQRERRKRFTRIDYIDVSPEARKVIDSLRDHSTKGTVSAILNRIVVEWAESHTGIFAHVRR
jgi:hypothetical protein